MLRERMLKMVLLGDANVGKTSMNYYYIEGNKLEDGAPTLGASFYSKQIKIGTNRFKLDIWDTAGQERFQALSTVYCRGASGCLCFFDVTNAESFDHVEKWLLKFEDVAIEPKVVVLVANKADIEEKYWKISKERILRKATNYNLPVIFTSALTGMGVDEAYNTLIKTLISLGALPSPDVTHNVDDDIINLLAQNENQTSGCYC
jgi:small GTP-binding protein